MVVTEEIGDEVIYFVLFESVVVRQIDHNCFVRWSEYPCVSILCSPVPASLMPSKFMMVNEKTYVAELAKICCANSINFTTS